MRFNHRKLTYDVIGAAMEVHSALGNGFLENVYEKALTYELQQRGLNVQTQIPVAVRYKGQLVGEYVVDLLVNELLIVELKAIRDLSQIHVAQTINYLAATNLELGLLLNFGAPSLQYRRIIHHEAKRRHESLPRRQ